MYSPTVEDELNWVRRGGGAASSRGGILDEWAEVPADGAIEPSDRSAASRLREEVVDWESTDETEGERVRSSSWVVGGNATGTGGNLGYGIGGYLKPGSLDASGGRETKGWGKRERRQGNRKAES